MSLDKSRTTWDSEFINGSVVESVGEFDELVEIKMKNPVSTLFFGFAQPFSPDKLFDLQFTIQNLRLKRSWIRDRDGGFTIALANVVDANVTYSKGRVKLSLSGHNILNATYSEQNLIPMPKGHFLLSLGYKLY